MIERGPENSDIAQGANDTAPLDGAPLDPQQFTEEDFDAELSIRKDIEAGSTDLRGFAFSELASDPEIGKLSSEEREALGEIYADFAETANLAQKDGAPSSAKALAVANAFTAVSPSKEGFWSDLVHTPAGKAINKFLAMVMLAGAGAMPLAANAGGGGKFLGFDRQQIANRAEVGLRGMNRVFAIDERIRNITIEMNNLEFQKANLSNQSAGGRDVAGIGNQYENMGRVTSINAQYEAGQDTIEARRLKAEARFAKKANPTRSDILNYQAKMKSIDAQEKQFRGKVDSAHIREEGRSVVRASQIRNEAFAAYATVGEIQKRQQLLASEQARLIAERGTIIAGTAINIGFR